MGHLGEVLLPWIPHFLHDPEMEQALVCIHIVSRETGGGALAYTLVR